MHVVAFERDEVDVAATQYLFFDSHDADVRIGREGARADLFVVADERFTFEAERDHVAVGVGVQPDGGLRLELPVQHGEWIRTVVRAEAIAGSDLPRLGHRHGSEANGIRRQRQQVAILPARAQVGEQILADGRHLGDELQKGPIVAADSTRPVAASAGKRHCREGRGDGAEEPAALDDQAREWRVRDGEREVLEVGHRWMAPFAAARGVP